MFWVTSDDLSPNFSRRHERGLDKTAASILPGAVDLSEVVDPRKQKDKKKKKQTILTANELRYQLAQLLD